MNALISLALFVLLANMQGSWHWYHLVGIGVLFFFMFAAYIIVCQEQVLYVPQPMRGMQVPADNPRGMRSPKDKGMAFEDVYMTTSDGEELHAWFMPAGGDTARHPCTECVVTIDVGEDEALGLSMDAELVKDGRLVVGAVEEEGAVARWNSANPSEDIRPFDAIVSVNGVNASVDEVLKEVQRKGAPLTITFQRAKPPTLLFCHENAGNIGFRVPNFALMQEKLQVNILAVDYRGYGHSTGTPSEEGLIEDALCSWKWMQAAAQSGKIDGDQMFVYGRSLGGAVAVGMAAELQKQGQPEPQGVILENTFVSISAMVDTQFPFLAWKSLKERFLRLKWESGQRIKDLTVPLLFLAGEKDELIPPVQMKDLIAAARLTRLKKTAVFPEGTHNDTWEKGGERYWDVQSGFIQQCCGRSSPVGVNGTEAEPAEKKKEMS